MSMNTRKSRSLGSAATAAASLAIVCECLCVCAISIAMCVRLVNGGVRQSSIFIVFMCVLYVVLINYNNPLVSTVVKVVNYKGPHFNFR